MSSLTQNASKNRFCSQGGKSNASEELSSEKERIEVKAVPVAGISRDSIDSSGVNLILKAKLSKPPSRCSSNPFALDPDLIPVKHMGAFQRKKNYQIFDRKSST